MCELTDLDRLVLALVRGGICGAGPIWQRCGEAERICDVDAALQRLQAAGLVWYSPRGWIVCEKEGSHT